MSRFRLFRRRPRSAATVEGTAVTARHIAGRTVSYSPEPDGCASPGEVIWVKVALEEDAFRGKDRPILIVGRRGERTVLALQLSSQRHRDGQPNWHPIGAGGWDPQRRPSWVRLDRVLEMHEKALRRESVPLDREVFDQVAARLRAEHGWR